MGKIIGWLITRIRWTICLFFSKNDLFNFQWEMAVIEGQGEKKEVNPITTFVLSET